MPTRGKALGDDLCQRNIEEFPTEETDTSLRLGPDPANPGCVAWVAGGGGGVTTWIALTDTPAAYTTRDYMTGVNAAATAIEFKTSTELAVGSTLALQDAIAGTFIGSGGTGNYGTVTGIDNTAIGDGAAAALTTATGGVYLGARAGDAITTVSESIAIGIDTLGSYVSTGTGGSVAIGTRAFTTAIFATDNNFFGGFEAGERLASTAANGQSASGNVGIGYRALRGIAVPSANGLHNNIGIGRQTGESMDGGSTGNVLVGDQVALVGTGDYNVGLGANTLTELTTGDTNIAIGRGAGGLTTTGDRNISIGLNADPSGAGVSDELNIGDTVFSDMSTGYCRIGGSGAISDETSLDLAATDGALRVNRLTQAQEDTLTKLDGMVWYNDTGDFLASQQDAVLRPLITLGNANIEGLHVSNDSVTPDEIVDIAAGACHMRDSTSDLYDYYAPHAAISPDVTVNGAGGLFNGAVVGIAADTLYAIFVIANSSTGAVSAGFDVAGDAPATMPAGFDKYRRIGYVLTDATSDFMLFIQDLDVGPQRWMWYNQTQATMQLQSDGTATSYTATATPASDFVPTSAVRQQIYLRATRTTGSVVDQYADMVPSSWTAADSPWRADAGLQASADNDGGIVAIMPVASDQLVEYRVVINGGGNAVNADLFLAGYLDGLN